MGAFIGLLLKGRPPSERGWPYGVCSGALGGTCLVLLRREHESKLRQQQQGSRQRRANGWANCQRCRRVISCPTKQGSSIYTDLTLALMNVCVWGLSTQQRKFEILIVFPLLMDNLVTINVLRLDSTSARFKCSPQPM